MRDTDKNIVQHDWEVQSEQHTNTVYHQQECAPDLPWARVPQVASASQALGLV